MVRYAPSDLLECCPPLPPPTPEAVDTTSADIVVDAGRAPDPTMLQQLLDGSPKFRPTWERNRPDLQDQSQSCYDLAIMHHVLASGRSDQDAVDAAVAHRADAGQSPKRHAYYIRTLAKARAGIGARDEVPAPVVSMSTLAWVPFPLDVLPRPVRQIVVEGARSIGCDPVNLVLAALAVLAGAIGTTRRIQIKRRWCEYPILWTLLIGASGRMRKSPAVTVISRPIRERQERELKKYVRSMDEYLGLKLKHDADVTEWKKDRKTNPNSEPPKPPKKPIAKRLFVADTTVEALAPILDENPRGVLLLRDELSGWLRGFNQYKAGGQGGDVPLWLEAHQGGMWMKDRRTNRELVSVPRAAVSVTGTTQPGIARACLSPAFYECGLVARLLMAQPPARLRTWSNDDVSSVAEEDWAFVVDQLHKLEGTKPGPEFQLRSEDGDGPSEEAGSPLDIPLTAEARERFARFVTEHGQRTAAADDDVGSALAKLEAGAARLALIFQLADAASEPNGAASVCSIDLEHVERGIQATAWFAGETERVYMLLRQDEAESARHGLAERIRLLGGEVTPRGLMRHVHRIKTAEDATTELDELVKHKLGRWEKRPPGPKGGRPSRVFVLAESEEPTGVDIDTTDATPGNPEVVSTSTAGIDSQRQAAGDRPEGPGPAEVTETASGEPPTPPAKPVPDAQSVLDAELGLEAAVRAGDEAQAGVARDQLAALTTPESAATVEQEIRAEVARDLAETDQ